MKYAVRFVFVPPGENVVELPEDAIAVSVEAKSAPPEGFNALICYLVPVKEGKEKK